mgnify:CR=1 FL=1
MVASAPSWTTHSQTSQSQSILLSRTRQNWVSWKECEIKRREGKRLKKNGSPELCLIERLNLALQILKERQPGKYFAAGLNLSWEINLTVHDTKSPQWSITTKPTSSTVCEARWLWFSAYWLEDWKRWCVAKDLPFRSFLLLHRIKKSQCFFASYSMWGSQIKWKNEDSPYSRKTRVWI